MASSSSSYTLAPLPLHSESLPLIDLRLLTQSELHSLSASSSFSPALSSQDDVVPKIDRSVFNESAGSRKQTYSRLRLAPRKPELSTSSSTSNPIHHLKLSSNPVFVNDLDHAENRRIVNLFKGLFGENGSGSDNGIDVELFDNNELVPVHIEYLDSLTNSSFPLYSFNNNNNGSGSDNLGVDGGSLSALHNVSVNVAPVPDLMHDSVANHSASGFKRKRGRPRKDENNIVDNDIIRDIIVSYEKEEEEEFREIKEDVSDNERLNRDGVEVDILGLGSMEDPYGEELRRRTVGLDKEEELLGFLSGLAGKWGSRRKKRKIVDANIFGNALPQGWKLLLSIKKKDGHAWLICRRYISPSGRHFISCKEVSSYLQSIFDLENVNNQSRKIVESVISSQQFPPAHVGDYSADGCRREDLGHGFTTHLVSPSMGHKKQAASTSKSSMIMKSGDIFNCHICSTSFSEGNDLLHHLLFSHKSTGKRRKIGANVGDGVIIRNGKFECQFCHKIFDERHRYSGHVGNHVKNYVKNIAAAPVLSTRNGMESAHVVEDPLITSMMDITIANDVSFIESPYDGGTEICLSSDRPRDKLQVRARSTLDSSSDRFNNDLSEHMQEVEWDRNDSLGVDISIDKLDGEYQMANAEVENVNEASGRTEVKLSLDNDAALSKDDNDRTCVNLDETGIMRSNDDKSEPEFSESCLPSFSGEEKDGSNNNTTKVTASSLEEAQEDRVDSSDAPSFLKESATEGKVNMLFSEREAPNRPAFGSPTSDRCSSVKDLLTISNQRVSSSSQLKSDVPENECTTTVETVGHQECIQPTLFCENQSFMLNNNLDELSNRIFGTKFNETGDSDEKEPQVGTDSYHFNIRDNVRVQLEGNSGYSSIPFLNQQMGFVSDSIDRVDTTTTVTYHGGTASGNRLASLPGSEQNCTVLETCSRDSCSEMKRETSGFRNTRDSELMTSFGGIQNGLEEGHMSNLQQEKNSEGISLDSSHLQASGVQNSMDASGSLMEKTRTEKAYFSGLVDSSGDQQTDERNGRMVVSSGNNRSRLDVNRDFEDHSLVFSGNEQAEGSQNNATGHYSASLESSKHGSAYASDLLTPYGQELMFGLENNLNREVPADTMWGGRSSQPVESSVNHDLMIGFGNNLTPRDQDVLSGNMWRTEENIIRSGLGDDASLPVVQSSNYFPTFGMIRNKGENELFGLSDRFDSLVDFEELKSGSIQQREYNFLASQSDSHPEKSHIRSYGTDTEQGFNSSLWLGNDSLLPKASTVSQSTATCGWCQNEYYDEAFSAATQTVPNSFGQICPSCKSKISGQLNVL